ncbi:hypothetical protein KCP69_09075 [Salmonella enterica subsp. enterica]|nr:hypothetical protein KCP69_09075 [Salmonella enterica subsp. enterica]
MCGRAALSTGCGSIIALRHFKGAKFRHPPHRAFAGTRGIALKISVSRRLAVIPPNGVG